jgi:UDP-N-acetyl-D-glucosamine dehydrogenase
MPRYVIQRTIEALNQNKKAINGSKVLLIGLAYKPNVDDDRESPTYKLMELYEEMGAEVSYYDPFVPVIRPSREYPHYAGRKSVEWNEDTISSYDAVVIATNHDDINYRELAKWADCIVDTRNAMKEASQNRKQVFKA